MSKNKNIKVIIVDDDVNWIKALTNFFTQDSDITVYGSATNAEQAFKLLQHTKADVILMDINLTENNLDGIYLAKDILDKFDIKIIMLTCLEEEHVIIDSFTAGAVNFVKKTDYKELPQVIRSTVNKTSPVEILIQEYHRLKEEELLEELTPVEKEIYVHLEDGYSRKEIANILYKSESTVKNQIRKIYEKLGGSNREEIIEKVKSRGLK
ncbi:response regulator transcription factor [Desulfuribacillus alkaliarsenatis]|uniref:DNA-binding response regulator n=1 Tax=Desulfuribacillus alkaliarsenatis TaxID=766136 RepID=A0A1E5G4T8_9FIRM|nr:response regulator transcription factor [Desulfuribacillus alkaliarsenatis]OEF98115.1 hypothetical protein BHF68_00020 [Desulfuribacillus alkaliarsenatis]